ncbi:uncharacterized protein [Typha latifolia]|uniref:uncharacterized protein n=1 Tax=Typha latifolia TaxID=4733 RepID=UPI003C2FC022
MAEPDSLLQPLKLPTPSTQTKQPSDKFISPFLYKAVFFVVFAVVLPLFPSQAPEFMSQTIFTRSWELLHLLFVGIAISYGLFSRKNADAELDKEIAAKAESPRSYVSQFLHVSPVFDDDEVDSPRGLLDDNKIQTWNSRYYPNEPVLMVAKGSTHGGQGHSGSNKPLLLPVRSLRPRAQEPELGVDGGGGGGHRGIDENDGIGETNCFDLMDSRLRSKESVVLPSPIPWRSRSAKFDSKEESSCFDATTIHPPSRTQSFRSSPSGTSSASPSPRRLSPSSSFSSEIKAKSSEDSVKKKIFYKHSPPPAPPPPPPFLGHGYHHIPDRKVTTKSFKDELKDLSMKGRTESQRSNLSRFDPPKPMAKPRNTIDSSSIGRSVRTIRPKEVQSQILDDEAKNVPEQSFGYEAKPPLPMPTYQTDEQNNELMNRKIMASDDSETSDSDSSEDDEFEESFREAASNSAAEAGPEENEVDKKADEFIAKFREQIRLQRIASIKRSTGQKRKVTSAK